MRGYIVRCSPRASWYSAWCRQHGHQYKKRGDVVGYVRRVVKVCITEGFMGKNYMYIHICFSLVAFKILFLSLAPLVAQMVKNLPAMQETWVFYPTLDFSHTSCSSGCWSLKLSQKLPHTLTAGLGNHMQSVTDTRMSICSPHMRALGTRTLWTALSATDR